MVIILVLPANKCAAKDMPPFSLAAVRAWYISALSTVIHEGGWDGHSNSTPWPAGDPYLTAFYGPFTWMIESQDGDPPLGAAGDHETQQAAHGANNQRLTCAAGSPF